MAWTEPTTRATGDLITAANWNSDIVENLKTLAPLDYVEITGDVSVTATTEGAADTVVTGTSQAYTAVPHWIEFFAVAVAPPTAIGGVLRFVLLEGATVRGNIGRFVSDSTNAQEHPVMLRRKITPSAATFSWVVKAYISTGTGTVRAGGGGSGANVPSYLRVTRA